MLSCMSNFLNTPRAGFVEFAGVSSWHAISYRIKYESNY